MHLFSLWKAVGKISVLKEPTYKGEEEWDCQVQKMHCGAMTSATGAESVK